MNVRLDAPALVVGGSIAGTAAALALARADLPVTLVEPRPAMPDAGFGVCLPERVLRKAVAREFIDPRLTSIPIIERDWLTAEGPERRTRSLWTQRLPAPVHALNWGMLWRGLRELLPSRVGIDERAVSAVVPGGTAVEVYFVDGSTARHPLVVGADGVASVVRRSVCGAVRPERAGYVSWRGTISAAEPMSALEQLRRGRSVTVGFDGGHLVAYRIPSADGDELVNWVLYVGGGAEGFERASAALPVEWADLLRASEFAPRAIGDMRLDRATADGVLLVGDASAVTRPHTASGATKAIEDAFALYDVVTDHDGWADAAAAFEARRTPAGHALVDLGRRLGRDQVEQTPPWATMTERAMESWASATLAGGSNFLYAPTS